MPRLSAERRRRNTSEGPPLLKLAPRAPSSTASEPSEPSDTWHPVIIDWYNGLRSGPEAEFMTPAGWAFVRYLAQRESMNLSSARPSAHASALFVAAQADLLTTEGARRRLRIELERAPKFQFPGLAEFKRVNGLG